ncbi:hypothetical protein MBLNU230_g6234t1 [Neophaeotheca triangularis]
MSDIQLYLIETGAGARDIAAQSAHKLDSKELKLIDLITTIGEYINSEDAKIRTKTVTYLAEVLELVRALSNQQRRLLCDFILGRLEGDTEGIGSSARALIALESHGKWDRETAQKVMRTFLDYTNPLKQFKLQNERYPVLQLVDLLLANNRDAIQQLHEDDPQFLPAFIAYFDGEKDPRNLMIVFSILQVPMTEWDLRSCAQDLFDSVFNYFPITFKPPPDDPYGITAQQLKDRLRDCIAASSDFAPYAFPALLDKLDSTSMNTKRDVLHTLQACTSNYETRTMNLYSITLWDALKFEVLNVQDEDLAEEALKEMGLMALKVESTEGPHNSYLRPIIKECCEHLEDAPTKQSQAAGRILHAVASAGLVTADKLTRGVLPTLFALHQSSDSIAKRRGLLEVFNLVVKVYCEIEGVSNPEALQTFASEGQEALLRALISAPKAEVSFRLLALEGLEQFLKIPKLIGEGDVERIVDSVTEIVLHERIEGHGDIRSSAIETLNGMAHNAPETIRNRAIPAFMVELPDAPTDESAYAPVLEAFAQLSVERQVFDTVVVRLKNKYDAASHQKASVEYQRALLLGMLYAFTFGAPQIDETGVLRDSYFTKYAEPLFTQVQNANQRDDERFEIIGRICNAILRPQSQHFQNSVCHKHLEWLTPAPGDQEAASKCVKVAPFSLYFFAAVRPETVSQPTISALLQTYAAILLEGKPIGRATSILLRHLYLLIDKFLDKTSMQASLDSANLGVDALLSDNSSAEATSVAFAVVKALIVQGRTPALTAKYTGRLLQLLQRPDQTIPRRFATLLAPDDILTKQNHCVVSGLFKQKTFSQLVPPLIESVRSSDSSTKPGHLVALSGILRWLPYSILSPQLQPLTPALLQCLDLTPTQTPDAGDTKSSALTIFEGVLMHDPNVVVEHTSSLISRLLNCTAVQGNNANVRASALQCLTLVPAQLAREKVMPFRRQVVKRLLPVLDDAKRSVRSEGVKCRSAWLGLEEEEEEEE